MIIRLPALPDPKLSANRYKKMVWQEAAAREAKQRDVWLNLLSKTISNVSTVRSRVSLHITLRGPKVLRSDPWTHLSHRGLKILIDCLTEPKPPIYDKKGRLRSKTYGIGLIPDDSYEYISSITVRAEEANVEETVVEVT